MSILADRVGAVNLAQGSPDFSSPLAVKEAAIAAINRDHNQYEMTMGSLELREAIASRARNFNGLKADPTDEITVTCGATEAITATIIALTESGDRVLIPEPFYENYVPAALISGASPIHVRFEEPDFALSEENLKTAFSKRPKAILVNTPNNPTGRVLSKKELMVIADLCEDYDVVAITDEIYENIVYDQNKHLSLATLGDMSERTVTISGMSKTFSITGWRIGYAIAEKHLTTAIRTIHDFLTVCAPTPFQEAAVKALAMPDSYYKELLNTYNTKRRFMHESLNSLGFRCALPEGAYYLLADFSGLSKKDDYEFSRYLIRDVGVAVVPASSFYSGRSGGKTRVRFTFTKKDATLKEAIKRMRSKLA